MKKIVCLVDSSQTSENAVRYAVQLAHDTASKLILVTLRQPKAVSRVMAFAGNEDDLVYNSSSRLPEMCDQLRSIWKVPCDYRESLDLKIETHELFNPDVKLIVAGIASTVQTTPHEVLSSIDFKMIRESSVPVLLVPDHFQYHPVKRLLYAYDYERDAHPPMDKLINLVGWLNVNLRFLSVIRKDYSDQEEEEIERKEAQIRSGWRSRHALSFDFIYYPDVSKCLNHYADLWRSDDIVLLSINHPSLVRRLFNKSVIKRMLLCGKYPVLIIPK